MNSWNTPSIESISSIEGRNTASTQSMNSTGSLSISRREYSRVSNPKILEVQQYSRVSNLKILKSTSSIQTIQPRNTLRTSSISRVLAPEILQVQAVSRVLDPEILVPLNTWGTSSIQSSIGPPNTSSTGRIRSIDPNHPECQVQTPFSFQAWGSCRVAIIMTSLWHRHRCSEHTRYSEYWNWPPKYSEYLEYEQHWWPKYSECWEHEQYICSSTSSTRSTKI